MSKNVNSCSIASGRIQTGDGHLYTSVAEFGDLAPTLAGLARGDLAILIGPGKVSLYQGRDGKIQVGLSITMNRIIALIDA